MKRLRFYSVSLLLGLSLLLAQCKHKDLEPALPPETQTGANTFGCMLNGQAWQVKRGSPGFNSLWVSPEGNGWLTINASYRDDNRFESMRFFSTNIFGIGDYTINRELNNRAIFSDSKKNIYMSTFDTDVVSEGVLTITKFDMANHIISGKFWFKLTKQDGSMTYEATDGRFDIRF
jgi:hypothetical protein